MTSGTASAKLRAEDLFSKPNHYLLEFAGPKGILVPMTRESYRQSIFTDPGRIVTAGSQTWTVDRVKLLNIFETLQIEQEPLRYVFHIANCGSTLFARAFDHIANCLVYREPYPLRQLSVAYAAHAGDPHRIEGWTKTLRLVGGLLGRRFEDPQAILVKANVPVNFVLPQVLGLHQGSSGILLYSSLWTYLVSALKSAERRQWIGNVLNEMSAAINSIEVLATVDLDALSTARAAGCVWLAQMHQFMGILDIHDELRTLDCEQFFEHPLETLLAACDFFGLDTTDDAVRNVIAGALFSEHAKFPGRRYDAATRRADLEFQAQALSDEISEGMAWANGFLEPLRIPAVLPNALL